MYASMASLSEQDKLYNQLVGIDVLGSRPRGDKVNMQLFMMGSGEEKKQGFHVVCDTGQKPPIQRIVIQRGFQQFAGNTSLEGKVLM